MLVAGTYGIRLPGPGDAPQFSGDFSTAAFAATGLLRTESDRGYDIQIVIRSSSFN